MNNPWCCRMYYESRPLFPFFLLTITLSLFSLPANAQIIPDRTLGNENSIVTPLDSLRERIDGGAIRGSNLFHSFLEFNIPEGRAAYFSNPQGIQSIFSRVTGNNPSHLLGTLGILGNANLFFINPNGIIFGQNARLDISGSFVASTANSITFPDGSRFNATNPEGVPLLTINVPAPIGLQFGEQSSATIINQGNLVTGGNLALVGGTVVSTGQLSTPNGEITLSTVSQGSVQLDKNGKFLTQESQFLTQKSEPLDLGELSIESGDIVVVGSSNLASLQGQKATLSAANNLRLVDSLIGTTGDLNLLAQGTVFITDSIKNPFLAVAGKNLVIEGKQGIDISALNHPASQLISGKEMILHSPNAVIGDAHFWSGGGFQIEKLDGSLGDLSSPNDPIIRSQGDVNFLGYQGASLHIIAGGSVNISTIIITETDSEANTINPTSTPDLANITLSDGTLFIIDGSKLPTLDIRAGVDPNVISDGLITGDVILSPDFDLTFPLLNLVIEPFDFPASPSSADITIGEVLMFPPDGLVLLTNQYKPNLLLSGGDITITGAGVLGIGGIDAFGDGGNGSSVIVDARGGITLTSSKIDTASDVGNGGNITLLANENILLESGAFIAADGVLGGNITVKSDADVLVTEGTIRSRSATTLPKLKGGDINIIARSLFLTKGGLIGTITEEQGQGGNLTLTASESLEIGGFSLLSAQTRGEGNGGNLTLNTDQLIIREGAEVSTITFGKGKGGNLTVTASELVELFGSSANGFSSKLSTETQGEGDVGDLTLHTGRLIVRGGTQITATTFDKGKGGNLSVTASESVELLGTNADGVPSGLFANSEGEGDAGNLSLETQRLLVRDGAQISAGTSGKGKAGNLTVTASELVEVVGTDTNSDASGLFVKTQGERDAGNLMIDTKRLVVRDGAQISAGTFGKGKGGILNVTASESVELVGIAPDGDPSGLFTATQGGEGDAGDLTLNTRRLLIQDGATITAGTSGKGKGGNLTVTASESVELIGIALDGNPSSLSVTTEGEGDAGNLILNTRQLLARDGAQINASTLGKGKGGSLNITASESVELFGRSPGGLFPSGLFAVTEGEKDAGNLMLNTRQLLVQNGAVISTQTVGKGKGGSLSITASELVDLSGIHGGLATQTQGEGDAGNLIITTKQFSIREGGVVSAATSGTGKGGTIIVNAPQSVTLGTNSQLTVETNSAGKPGDINITTNTLTIGEDAQLSATVAATSTNTEGGGSITLNANNLNISGKLGIFAETQSIAPAGNLILKPYNSPNLNIQFTDNGFISASTSADGQGGNINISAPQTLNIRGEGKIAVETSGKGNAGKIELTSQNLTLADGLEISASTTGEGNAGNINLNANNITLSESEINAFTESTGNAGSISLSSQGNNATQVTLSNNSQISTEIRQNGQAENPSNIEIETDNLILDNSTITASTQGKGDAGSITVPNAQTITLYQSEITASTSGEGDTGEINLNVNQKLELTNSQINSAVEQGAVGNSQQITLNTPNLELNSSEISAATAGQGNAGNILVDNANTVILDNSTISTAIAPTGFATQPSNITLNTQQLTLDNNSQITASTFGKGRGGNINVTAKTIDLINSGQIRTTTAGNNDAGDINLKITESLNLRGNNTGIFADTAINSFGNGGSIFIDPLVFKIQDGATVSVNSQGKGIGGNITILSNNLLLNQGTILAQSSSNQGGNIALKIDDTLTLRNGSQISTTAGTAEAGGDGGNIDISARLILSNFYENNDITANAFTGKGGNITINALTILGLAVQENLTPFSDITASSQFGLAGNITLNLASLNPTRGLENLASETITPEIRQVCQTAKGKDTAEFYEIGKGGLSESPDMMLNAEIESTWIPWVKPSEQFSWQTLKNSEVTFPNPSQIKLLKLPCQN